tara:strand:+ start:22 stop:234 length:213 start_codon:yes stop_codon:yes gene_type:complete
MAKIDANTYELEKCSKLVKSYKEDDMFLNTENNYNRLYQKLEKFQNMIDQEFRPEIKSTKLEKNSFAKKA